MFLGFGGGAVAGVAASAQAFGDALEDLRPYGSA